MKKLPDQSAPISGEEEGWLLRLYVAGQTPKSMAAISNLTKICDEYLTDKYEIEVVDLHEHPDLASENQIVAVPTLLRVLPAPVRKMIGDLSSAGCKAEIERVLLEKLPSQPALPMKKAEDNEDENEDRWLLRLYVAGQTPKSVAAISNLKKICEEHLVSSYEIEVIDLLENPHLASENQIIAIPTLLRILPSPVRKLIGDLSNSERTLIGLDLQPKN